MVPLVLKNVPRKIGFSGFGGGSGRLTLLLCFFFPSDIPNSINNLLLSVEYFSTVFRFLKQWIRHPYFSITCCQNLLLPVNDTEEDSGGIIGKDDDLKSQLEMEDGRLEMTPTRRGMNNEGLEGIVEEGEIDETGIPTTKTPRGRSVKMQRYNDVDLGIGGSSVGAQVESGKAAVTKVEVHDVDVEVHGARANMNEAREEVNVEMREQEAQTDLSLLEDMDQEAIEQLGFAYDESL